MSAIEIINTIEEREINVSYILWSPQRKVWCYYARNGAGREWRDADSFADCVRRLAAE